MEQQQTHGIKAEHQTDSLRINYRIFHVTALGSSGLYWVPHS
jgi:hypothetical protein